MKSIKIYFTSDVHGCVYPTDYTSSQIKPMGFLAIGQTIKKDENTLLIDGGDTIQGSPFSTFVHKQYLEKSGGQVMPQVLNHLGYDYVTLGNHDFNYGYDYLASYTKALQAKVLCANVKDRTGNMPLLPYDIKTMPNGMRLGLIGMTSDYINVWEQPEHIRNFEITEPIPLLQQLIDTLRPQVDLIIGIYHGGFERDIHTHESLTERKENVAFKICQTFDFDLLMTGHQHIPIVNETLFDTHIVQTPMNGLQYVEIRITEVDQSAYQIQSSLHKPQPIKETPVSSLKNLQDIRLEDLQNSYPYNQWTAVEDQVQDWLDIRVGTLDLPLVSREHLDMALTGSLIANFLNQVQIDASSAEISCTSLANRVFGMAKTVTLRDIVSTYIYPNTIQVLEVSGAVLIKALERSASYFKLEKGQVKVSDAFMKPKVEHYNYDYFSGIQYAFDLNRPLGQRVTRLTFKGTPVQPSDTYKVVMNNYRSSGAGGYDFYSDCPILEDIQITTANMVSDYIKKFDRVVVDQSKYFTISY